jgi:formylglycine-generating enzyme required for sulfatase activity
MRKVILFFLIAMSALAAGCPVPPESPTPPNVPIISYRDLVDVPAITDFVMGDSTFPDGTVNVPLISAFRLGKYEVTYELWFTVRAYALDHGYEIASMGREGSHGKDGDGPAGYGPVTFISWRSAIVWCNAYSEMEGLTPVYYTDNAMQSPLKECDAWAINLKPGSCDNPYVDWTANGFRLPTEAEWEYAARRMSNGSIASGRKASGYYGAFEATLATQHADEWQPYCWFLDNSDNPPVSHNVGTTSFSNSLGIFDMSGNVFEFCWDWNGTFPLVNTDENPKGATGPGPNQDRIMRGGSFGYPANTMMTALRSSSDVFSGGYHIGFRVARNAN